MHQGKTDCVYIFQIICSYLIPDQVIHFSYFQRLFWGKRKNKTKYLVLSSAFIFLIMDQTINLVIKITMNRMMTNRYYQYLHAGCSCVVARVSS